MELHILGGLLDDNGSSQELSNWLIPQLAHFSAIYRSTFHCTLQTCIISSLNHHTTKSMSSSSTAPWGRGLACDLATGHVYLAWCHASAMGPDAVLISTTTTSGVHTEQDSEFVIEAFDLSRTNLPIPFMLSLSDDQLLSMTST